MKTYLIIAALLIVAACSCKNKQTELSKKVIIGYVYVGDSLINSKDINAEKLTHINYAFANIVDGKIAEGFKSDSANYIVLNSLKKKNPELKILVSIGGWSWSDGFSDMAASKESRKKFIESAIRFTVKHKIDGIDLDWEYPGLPGEGNPYKAEDKQNFTLLLQELRLALSDLGEKDGKQYLLTIAAGAFANYVANIEPTKIYPILDYINLMSYDFMGEWDTITGHLTNLYDSEFNPKANSCEKAVNLFTQAGVPTEKLVLGVAFYGRGWRNVSAKNNGLFQNGKGYNPGYTFKTINEKYLGKKGYTKYFDSSAKAPYIYNADSLIFITYEDQESIKFKCEYIKNKNLGGAMFWENSTDYNGKLLNAIFTGLR